MQRDEFKKSTLELNKRLNEDSSLALQIDNIRTQTTNTREEVAKLQARHATIKETVKADTAVKKILDQKTPGIHGTVADLGEVNSKYSLALEIAAGPRLKSIVVEDDKVAAELIKYLKQNKLGIATFLPLNKIKPKETSAEVLNGFGRDTSRPSRSGSSFGATSSIPAPGRKTEKVSITVPVRVVAVKPRVPPFSSTLQ